jgi:cytochrome c556
LSDYDAARPYLQQEQRYFEATTRQWSQQTRQMLQDMKQHLAAVQVGALCGSCHDSAALLHAAMA